MCAERIELTDSQPPDSAPEPVVEPAGPVGESRGERAGRHLHRARLYTWAVAFVGLLVVLIVLISVNTRTVKLSWAFGLDACFARVDHPRDRGDRLVARDRDGIRLPQTDPSPPS